MSQRQNIIMFDSAEVQGEGSWVKIRMITHGQRKEFLARYGDILSKSQTDIPIERRTEMQNSNDQLVIQMVVDWNWVDDEGIPLPLPKDDPAVLDTLTELEHVFIAQAMQGEGERKKS